jgi:deoxyinosine 3'endonuclease (endonuclease V)
MNKAQESTSATDGSDATVATFKHSEPPTTVMLNHTSTSPNSVSPDKLAKWRNTQAELLNSISFSPLDLHRTRNVAGVDISFSPNSNMAVASLVILPYPPSAKSIPLYTDFYFAEMMEPYVAGYLAFREMDHLHALFGKLEKDRPELYPPDVTLVDGNGTWHPRGLGSASHLGVTLGIPTIGVAKTFFHLPDVGIGHEMMKSLSAHKEEIVGTDGKTYGMAIQTGGSKKHVFVSCGHLCDLACAVKIVQACSSYRIPEPIRRADLESRRVIRDQNI